MVVTSTWSIGDGIPIVFITFWGRILMQCDHRNTSAMFAVDLSCTDSGAGAITLLQIFFSPEKQSSYLQTIWINCHTKPLFTHSYLASLCLYYIKKTNIKFIDALFRRNILYLIEWVSKYKTSPFFKRADVYWGFFSPLSATTVMLYFILSRSSITVRKLKFIYL